MSFTKLQHVLVQLEVIRFVALMICKQKKTTKKTTKWL